MTAIIAFIVANGALIFGVLYAIINVLVAIFAKNEKVVGILAIIRSVLERISALEPRNSANTIKVPGRKASEPAPVFK